MPRQLIPRLGLAGLTVVLTLLAIEIGFRLLRTDPWYERIVEEQKPPEWSLTALTDFSRVPLRDDPGCAPKEPGTHRILFLGDSFTFGAGIEDPADLFVSIVEDELNELGPLPEVSAHEAFNGGIYGSLTDQWLSLFRQLLEPFDPDLVVAVFFLRDGASSDVTSALLIRGIEEGMSRLEEESALYRMSYLYRFLKERSAYRALSEEYLALIRQAYFGTPEQTAEWQTAQQNLLKIKRQVERRGGHFALVIFPMLIDLDEDYPLRDVCDTVERFCLDQDIPVHSLLPDFIGQDAPELWVSLYDQHPNEKGHEIAARSILRFLRGLLPELASR